MLPLLRADFQRLRSRRALWLLALGVLAAYLFLAWSNYQLVQQERSLIAGEESRLRRLPEELRAFNQGRDVTEQQLNLASDSIRGIIRDSEARVDTLRLTLSPRYSHRIAMQFMASFTGIAFGLVLASTFLGTEFQWNYWRALAIQEPRRHRLLISKVIVLLTFILIASLGLLALSYPINWVFGKAFKFAVMGGAPAIPDVLDWIGRAWICIAAYTLLAVLFVVLTRSTLAGTLGPIAFIFVDSFLGRSAARSSSFVWFKTLSFAQHIANVIGTNISRPTISRAWFLSPSPYDPFGGIGREPAAYPGSTTLAVIVLAMMLFVAFAVWKLRKAEL